VQSVSLQIHMASVRAQISVCFYNLVFDKLMVVSGSVFCSNGLETETFPFFLNLDLFSQ